LIIVNADDICNLADYELRYVSTIFDNVVLPHRDSRDRVMT